MDQSNIGNITIDRISQIVAAVILHFKELKLNSYKRENERQITFKLPKKNFDMFSAGKVPFSNDV